MSRAAANAGLQSLEQATAWLRGLIDVERRPDWPYQRFSLDPIRALLARLGNPERALPVVHVAGSKGKGSTALLTEAILRGAGRRVGTYTSPHLERWTERFRVDGVEIDGSRLAAAVDQVRPHVEALCAGDARTAPTFFDAITAAALALFAEARVECAVLEVGLGGRLDSTNACEPAVTCITSIELEHTDRLGNSLAAIAAEKAGILKRGIPAVVGRLPDEALEVVERRAAEVGAPIARFGRDFEGELLDGDLEGSRIRLRDGALETATRLPLLGAPSVHNAALALACARRLLGDAVPAPALAELARSSLASVELPGRIEVVRRRPLILVDAAHTADSAQALASVLERLARPLRLVLSISEGKDVAAILAPLLPLASSLVLTRAEPVRSMAPEALASLASRLAPDLPALVEEDPRVAVRSARARCADTDAMCVTGSVYLAGIARSELRLNEIS
ncbi:MAG TPA: folylpolyglutamate synthase/dihydrofolate synthase family protein [Myxococcota bacterium]|nr:folylpolyglutamate synthase/dihydrofolate synthase family protein [Myxococcota bacterium]